MKHKSGVVPTVLNQNMAHMKVIPRKQHAKNQIIRNNTQSSWPVGRGQTTRTCFQAQFFTPRRVYIQHKIAVLHNVGWKEDPIATCMHSLSNKFTSGLVGVKSAWQNTLTCQMALQFHYIILCIAMLRILSPLDTPFRGAWMPKTAQCQGHLSVLLNYLEFWVLVILNDKVCYYALEIGTVFRSRQTDWVTHCLSSFCSQWRLLL